MLKKAAIRRYRKKCLMLQRKIIAYEMEGWTGDPSPLADLYCCGYWGKKWKDGLQFLVCGMRWKEAQISGMQKFSKHFDQKPCRRRKNIHCSVSMGQWSRLSRSQCPPGGVLIHCWDENEWCCHVLASMGRKHGILCWKEMTWIWMKGGY